MFNIKLLMKIYLLVKSKVIYFRSSNFTFRKKTYNIYKKSKERLEVPDIIRSSQNASLTTKKSFVSLYAEKRASISGGGNSRRELQRSIKILVMIVISHIFLSTPGNVLYIVSTIDQNLVHHDNIPSEGKLSILCTLDLGLFW